MKTLTDRICVTCNKELDLAKKNYPNGKEYLLQAGFYCCEEYYCSENCLNHSFQMAEETWEQHYERLNDCYWTEWELNLNGEEI